MKEQWIAYLNDPTVFAVNRLPVCARPEQPDETVLTLDGAWGFDWFERPELLAEGLLLSGEPPRSVTVPGHLQLQGYGRPQYTNVAYPWDGHERLAPPAIPRDNPTGLYIRRFTLPAAPFSRAVLRLEGAEPCCVVVLNGQFIGYAEDSFSPSEFDITAALVPGENRLCVIVARYCSGSWLEDQDFWRFSGLFRSVSLRLEGACCLRDLSLVPTLDDGFKSGLLRARALIFSKEEADAELLLGCGEECAREKVRLQPGEQWLELSLPVPAPALWSAEEPRLYDARLELSIGTETVIRACQPVGFRRIELRDGLMLLNGKRLVFRGVNRHEWSARTGRALTRAEIEADIRLLKQNNFNAVRTSHYPNQEYFYELCDRAGLYVIDETNLETHGTWMLKSLGLPGQTPLPDGLPAWRGAVLDRGRSLYARDKNHACVLIWSCGNESYGGETLYALSNEFRALDPHRLVHYEGVFHDRRYPGTSDMESRMYAKPRDVERYLRAKPQKPFILCEYAHAMGNSFGNVDEYIALEDKYPQYQGGFIWDWIDQAIHTSDGLAVGGDFCDRPNDRYFCGDGLLFADRTPSPKLREAKYLYAPLRIVCGAEGVTVENRNLFAGTDDVVFAWTYTEDGRRVADGRFTLAVPPGQTRAFPLSLPQDGPGERILTCTAQLIEGTPWIPAGHVLAFGQSVLSAKPFMPLPAPVRPFTGMANIGAHMNGAHAIIDRKTGLLVSLKKEAEFLLAPVTPDFWRAPTDNDSGCGQPLRWAKWKRASLYRAAAPALVHGNPPCVTALYRSGGIAYRIDYRFFESDTLEMTLTLFPTPGDAPRVGFALTLPPAFSHIRWYGNGAPEAASDRRSARCIGLNESSVQEQYVPYLNPQDCAGKTDLRWFSVCDDAGHTLTLSSDRPFEASALPWTSHELENAASAAALPPVTKTVLCASLARCGVGGDDSWGARVHGQHRVKTWRGLRFTLRLRLS